MGNGPEQRRSERRTKRALIVATSSLLFVVVFFFGLLRSPLPASWTAEMAVALSDELGVPVSVEDVVLSGPARLTLRGVDVDGPVPLQAERIVVGFSWSRLWRAKQVDVSALRSVRLERWEATVPTDEANFMRGSSLRGMPDAAAGTFGPGMPPSVFALAAAVPISEHDPSTEFAVESRDGRVTFASDAGTWEASVGGTAHVRGGQIDLERVIVADADVMLRVDGTVTPAPDLFVVAETTDVAAVASRLLPATTAAVAQPAGRATVEARLRGTWDAPDAWGRVRWREAQFGSTRDDENDGFVAQPYAADDIIAKWAYIPNRGFELVAEATKAPGKLRLEGVVALDGQLDFVVNATDLELPRDVPVLAQWDIDGVADFAGTLTGHFSSPVLSGELASDGGRIFGQPFSTVVGRLGLTKTAFSFDRTRIAQGTADYFLEGVIRFAAEDGSEPGHLQVELRTDRGRVEALTAALGWEVPVRAGLAATLEFSGPFGAVTARGDVGLQHGIAWEQRFDELAGTFEYTPERFSLEGVTARVRGGTLQAAGGGPLDGGWEVNVEATDVPLQAVSVVRNELPRASGLVDFSGRLHHDAAADGLVFGGGLTGKHLQLGTLDFAEAHGEVAMRNGTLTTEGLTLQRRNGATYTVVGGVDVIAHAGEPEPASRLDVAVTVADERLAELLAYAGLQMPVTVADGKVGAQIAVQGSVADPTATVRIDAPDVNVVGRRAALGLDVLFKDGRIRVEDVSRSLRG